jgi:aminoglycoside 6'-N-acetyltransferase I
MEKHAIKYSIRKACPKDAAAWVRMRCALWPKPEAIHRKDTHRFFKELSQEPLEVFFAIDRNSEPIGFIELSIRPYADGCTSDRVAYIEGWYTIPKMRGLGVGAALITKAEQWAVANKCLELASDTEIANTTAAKAHKGVGFSETGRIVCFKKVLNG